MGVNSQQPVVGGVAVARVQAVSWEREDDTQLDIGDWRVLGRARVDFVNGGLANGLLLTDAPIGVGGPQYTCVAVIWERPLQGGPGKFRLLPLGSWA
jgi:hypothetical protein